MDKCPIGLEDLPYIVTEAISVFNSLGDRVVPDIGYIGKDYSNFNTVLEIRDIKKSELLFDIVLYLDNNCIKDSSEKLQQARELAKKGNK